MRISREQMFMGIARVVSSRSTCCRLNVGAVLVDRERQILSIGYNGSAPGEAHCDGVPCRYFTPQGCKVIHAEVNAIAHAHDIPHHSSLYVTHSPCLDCAARLAGLSISAIYYEIEYRLTEPIDFLITHGVRVLRLLPSGYLEDKATKEIIAV